jgi:hypothetical protein
MEHLDYNFDDDDMSRVRLSPFVQQPIVLALRVMMAECGGLMER